MLMNALGGSIIGGAFGGGKVIGESFNKNKKRADNVSQITGPQLPVINEQIDSYNANIQQGDISVNENVYGDMPKYSIKHTTDNKPVVVVENDILEGVPRSEWVKTVKDTITQKFSQGIPISGRLVKVNQKTKNEFTYSRKSQYYSNKNDVIYADKFKSANNLDEIVLASTNYINEDLNHERKDNLKEFARGDVQIKVGNNDYSAKVIVGFTGGNQMILYDVIDFIPTNFKIKETDMSSPSNHNKVENGSNIPVSSTTNIPQIYHKMIYLSIIVYAPKCQKIHKHR